MIASVAFAGFRPELIDFLRDLRQNNTRAWFQAHYDDYQHSLVEPARDFVVAMGDILKELGEDIHAEPKVRGSIFAINRDIRFSPDKTLYKAYLDLWFWQGDGTSRERPGYFLRLEPERLILGAGMHNFSEPALTAYRTALTDAQQARRLAQAIDTLGPHNEVGGKTLKRTPQGFSGDPELLKYTGLHASTSLEPVPAQTFSSALPEFCLAHYRRLAPLQQWLVTILPR
jgi:uncharacterized protein (TIGR02453 family)